MVMFLPSIREIPTPFYVPLARKRYPFRAEHPRIVNYRKRPHPGKNQHSKFQFDGKIACSRLSIGGSERKHRRAKKQASEGERAGARGLQTLLIFPRSPTARRTALQTVGLEQATEKTVGGASSCGSVRTKSPLLLVEKSTSLACPRVATHFKLLQLKGNCRELKATCAYAKLTHPKD